jgi:hypothetical protein
MKTDKLCCITFHFFYKKRFKRHEKENILHVSLLFGADFLLKSAEIGF